MYIGTVNGQMPSDTIPVDCHLAKVPGESTCHWSPWQSGCDPGWGHNGTGRRVKDRGSRVPDRGHGFLG